MHNYDDYDDELEEYNENLEEDNEKNKKDKRHKKSKKTKRKKIVKNKTKKKRPKTKVVYKEKEKGSGCLIFILILIILGLIAVIGYLVYVNYYKQEDTNNNTPKQPETTEKICEAKATKFNISSGLKKCSGQNNFKLIISGTDLSFDITRTNDNKYIINSIYYKNQKINGNKIIGIKLDENFQLKEKDNVMYLLVQNNDNQVLTIIDNGKVIYQNSEGEYKLTSDITYKKYTNLGLEDINTCEYYETNNLLDSEMWSSGKLVYENGAIIEKDDEVVTAKDVCKK